VFERLTPTARAAIRRAPTEAQALGKNRIDPEHLLLAILDPECGAAARLLRDAGVTRDAIISAVGGPRTPERIVSDEDADALRSIGIDVDAVLARITESLGADALRDATAATPTPNRGGLARRMGWAIQFSTPGRRALSLSLHEAVALGQRQVSAEHLLLGIARQGGVAGELLASVGLTLDWLREIASGLGNAA
jgi:ClpA/ClpB-like protein